MPLILHCTSTSIYNALTKSDNSYQWFSVIWISR